MTLSYLNWPFRRRTVFIRLLVGLFLIYLCVFAWIYDVQSIQRQLLWQLQRNGYFYNHKLPTLTYQTDFKLAVAWNRTLSFKVLLHPDAELLCPKGTVITVMLQSMIGDFDLRQSVRSTWATQTELSRYNASVVFVLSTPLRTTKNAVNYDRDMRRLRNESADHNDILLTNLEENYKNVYQKWIAGNIWLHKHCQSSNYIKADSNILISLETAANVARQNATDKIFGNCFCCNKVFRGTGQWGVPKSDYLSDRWPRYCGGTAYMYDRTTQSKLLGAISNSTVVKLEDAWASGILAETAKVQRINAFKDAQFARMIRCHTGNQLMYEVAKGVKDQKRAGNALRGKWSALKSNRDCVPPKAIPKPKPKQPQPSEAAAKKH